MQLNLSVELNLNLPEVEARVKAAAQAALTDVVIQVAKDGVENSPVSDMWPSISKVGRTPTGNNKRSIQYQVGGAEGPGNEIELDELQGAVYSTSGYGGYLETGTSKMPARPYIKPAADERFTDGEMAARVKEKLGE